MGRLSITPELVKRASDRFTTDTEAADYLGVDVSKYRRFCIGFGIRASSQLQKGPVGEVPTLDEEDEPSGDEY